MTLTNLAVLNGYSVIVLVFILIHALQHAGINGLQHKLYLVLLQVTILMLLVDIFSRFDGHPGTVVHGINVAGNFLVFLLNPILPSLWVLYVHDQVFHDDSAKSSGPFRCLPSMG